MQHVTQGGPPCSAPQARRHALCTSSMGDCQDGRHRQLAHHQLPLCWRSLGLGASVRAAAQTAKPCMSHKPGSGVGDDINCHYLCFPTAPTVQRWAQPCRYTLGPVPSLLWPFLFAKASPKVLSWLPACSPLQQEEREQELLKGGCEEVLGHSVRSFL